MVKTTCQQFLDDPDRFAGHLEECADCRRAAAELEKLDMVIAGNAVGPETEFSRNLLDRLPLAPWEGAAHRAWTLVLAVASILVFGAAALFFLGGIPPLEGFRAAVTGSTTPALGTFEAVGSLPPLLAHLPTKFHLLLGIAFVLVNVVFIALLRRTPRGYDASR